MNFNLIYLHCNFSAIENQLEPLCIELQNIIAYFSMARCISLLP